MQKIRLSKILAFVLSLSLVLLLTPRCASEEGKLLEGSYSYDKDGWRFVYVEGGPYQRGFQLGYILADDINDYKRYIAHQIIPEGGIVKQCCRVLREMAWKILREMATMEYWDKVPEEYKQEIKGIAEGAEAKGYDVDYKDILVINSGLDLGYKYKEKLETVKRVIGGGCSAFIANGSYTENGDVVIAHNTWMSYSGAKYFYYMIYVKPEDGYEFLMQSGPGMIWSSTDWYINSAGLMVTETTLGFDGNGKGVAPYNDLGIPVFVRARRAIQYSESIDHFVDTMIKDNNGAYACDWLMGDAETNEIAILELGLNKWCLKRTTDGFYGSCNYIWDEGVRSEWLGVGNTDPPSIYRWKRWKQLGQMHRGEINTELAKDFLGDHFDLEKGEVDITAGRHIICGHLDLRIANPKPHGTIDGKVTSSKEAIEMRCFTIRGHPCGTGFNYADFIQKNPEYKHEFGLEDMPSYSWTSIGPQ